MPGFIYSNRDSKDRWFVLVPENDTKNSMELRSSHIWNYRSQLWNVECYFVRSHIFVIFIGCLDYDNITSSMNRYLLLADILLLRDTRIVDCSVSILEHLQFALKYNALNDKIMYKMKAERSIWGNTISIPLIVRNNNVNLNKDADCESAKIRLIQDDISFEPRSNKAAAPFIRTIQAGIMG